MSPNRERDQNRKFAKFRSESEFMQIRPEFIFLSFSCRFFWRNYNNFSRKFRWNSKIVKMASKTEFGSHPDFVHCSKESPQIMRHKPNQSVNAWMPFFFPLGKESQCGEITCHESCQLKIVKIRHWLWVAKSNLSIAFNLLYRLQKLPYSQQYLYLTQ